MNEISRRGLATHASDQGVRRLRLHREGQALLHNDDRPWA